MGNNIDLVNQANNLSEQADLLAKNIASMSTNLPVSSSDHFMFLITIFTLSCFVGYFVVWKVTPALHTPLMSLTNAVSGIIIVGAILAVGSDGFGFAQILGFLAVTIASINIFGGFIVTERMLKMFKR